MWVFNWWTRGDVLGWANADPCVDRIHVRVDVVAPDLGEKHPHGEQDDDNEPMCSIVLARVSTFPWTPTLRGIQTAEDAVDVMDSHGSSILASAETWLETAASHIRGDLATRMESPAGVDYVEATRALASVVADEHCVLSLAPPLACCPTYFHASWQGRTFAAFEEQSDTLLSIIRSSFNHRKQLQTLNIRPIRALYVAGPAGSGKEFLIMHTIAARARMPVVYIHISEELDAIRKNAQSTRPGLTPLKKAVWKAILCAPSVLLVDGMSLLALEPKFADVDALDAASHVAGLLSMAPRATVCIVAPVVDPTKLPDVLRPGVDEARLFSRVVELPIPSAMQRESLCRACFGMLAAASHPFMRGGSGSVAAVARGGEAMPGMSVAGALLPDEIESLSRHIAQVGRLMLERD
nr:hypothetical protein HK105_002973 [Polyrhizophydium stewartii]